MGKIDFHVAHTLSLDEAKRRMERLTAHWAKQGIQSTWAGDVAKLSGKVMGIHLDATLRVTDKTVGGEASIRDVAAAKGQPPEPRRFLDRLLRRGEGPRGDRGRGGDGGDRPREVLPAEAGSDRGCRCRSGSA